MANPEDALQYLFRARLSRRDMTSLYFRNTARALAFFEHLPHEFLMTVGYDELEVFFVTRTSQGVVGLARDRATKSVNFIWREENFIANAFQVGDSIDVWWFFNALHNKYGFVVRIFPPLPFIHSFILYSQKV